MSYKRRGTHLGNTNYTRTQNTNKGITYSVSTPTGSSGRKVYSTNSKTGAHKVTTYQKGANGFTTRKTQTTIKPFSFKQPKYKPPKLPKFRASTAISTFKSPKPPKSYKAKGYRSARGRKLSTNQAINQAKAIFIFWFSLVALIAILKIYAYIHAFFANLFGR